MGSVFAELQQILLRHAPETSHNPMLSSAGVSVNASISFAGGACRQAVCRPFTWPKGVAVAVFPLTL